MNKRSHHTYDYCHYQANPDHHNKDNDKSVQGSVRDVDNIPVSMVKHNKVTFDKDKPTKPPTFANGAVYYSATPISRAQPMLIHIDNIVPTIVMHFGTMMTK